MNRRILLWSGVACLVLATALGALVVFVYPATPGFDQWWNALMVATRADWTFAFALGMNWIGGGWVAIFGVPLLTIAALLLARRWRGALFAAICFLASAGMVQLLKNIFGRARPDDMLVVSDYGSFPSGHTANAATIAVVLWLLFPRVWVALVGALWVVAMALSRTFLSVHWATDTIGGALVGAGVVLVLGAALWRWIDRRTDDARAADRLSAT